MNRRHLSSLASLSFALTLAAPLALHAQAPPDFSKVEIKTTKLTDNFYTLEGQGGTIGVLPGPDGVFMVDSQFAPLSEKIAAAIKQISDRPIRFLVNTHVHGDHTGGDANFGKMGVTILARRAICATASSIRIPAPMVSPASRCRRPVCRSSPTTRRSRCI